MERDYKIIGTITGNGVPSGTMLYTCPDDGVAVINQDGIAAHDAWHEYIEHHGSIGAVWRMRCGYNRKPIV